MPGERVESGAFYRWVSPAVVGVRLDAPYYDPAFDDIETLLAERPGQIVPLGDLVAEVLSHSKVGASGPVLATSSVPLVSASSISSHAILDAGHLVSPNALDGDSVISIDCEGVIASTIFRGHHFALYSPAIHGAPAALTKSVVFLRTKEHVDPAFLASELNESYVAMQLERLSRSGFIPRIATEDLLGVLVVVPPSVEQASMAHDLRLRSTIFASGSAGAAAVTGTGTGATFEQVLESIEQEILGADFASSDQCRFIEWNSTGMYERTGRIWGLPRRKEGIVGDHVPMSADVRAWVREGDSGFRLFNSCNSPGLVDYEMLAGIKLAPQLSSRQLSAILDFLAFLQESGETRDAVGIAIAAKSHRAVQRTFTDEAAVLEVFRENVRPILLLAVERHGQPYGAFLVSGAAQLPDPTAVHRRLWENGLRLAVRLKEQMARLPEIARLTASQTVTELMHRIKNPLADIDTAVEFLRLWAERNGFLGQAVPDEHDAEADADEHGLPVSEFTVSGYLQRIRRAKSELGNLSRKLRHLARAESGGSPAWHSLTSIIGSALSTTRKRPAEHVGGIAGPGRRGGRWRGERRGGARHNTRP